MTLDRIILGILLVLTAAPCAVAQSLGDPSGQGEPPGWALPTPNEEILPPTWQPSPVGETITPPMASPAALSDRFRESTWYTRMDYFLWNERIGGGSLLNESGPLWTLGYQRRDGRERFRGEFFAGVVGYHSRIDYGNGVSEPFSSRTNYMGLKGEYDLLFDSVRFPTLNWYGGIGTRFWIRDLPDDYTPSGNLIGGYQETWWTVYPYVGAMRRHFIQNGPEFYWSGRVGLTAITLVHGTYDDTRLYPLPGLVGYLEAGIRRQQAFLSANVETFNWSQSPEVRGWIQPTSSLVLIGIKAGINF